MTEIYLGYPPENVKAWILAHSAPAAKAPVWGEGKWVIDDKLELEYDSDQDMYYSENGAEIILGWSGQVYITNRHYISIDCYTSYEIDISKSDEQILTLVNFDDENDTRTFTVKWIPE